jgi:hypothetical protein
MGHIVHNGASGVRNIDALFFMLEWALCVFHKKCTGTCYIEPVFLHPVGSMAHVVDLGCDTSRHYFSCSGSHWHGFHK